MYVILIYIGCINENATFMQFNVILSNILLLIQPALSAIRNN